MLIHTIFDLLAWIAAAGIARWVWAMGWLASAPKRTPFTEPYYFIALSLGALAGAIVFGSANLTFAGMFSLGHSIAGALLGGIVSVEIYKWARHLSGSTGIALVAPLASGIAIGRWGCFFAGLPDYTYGTTTSLPWSVDFGDGALRHPVQLYESAAMLAFLVVYLRGLAQGSVYALRDGFYLFVLWYALQRFAWEFFKPYPPVFGPFNLFHILCAFMAAYAIVMIGRNRDLRQAV